MKIKDIESLIWTITSAIIGIIGLLTGLVVLYK